MMDEQRCPECGTSGKWLARVEAERDDANKWVENLTETVSVMQRDYVAVVAERDALAADVARMRPVAGIIAHIRCDGCGERAHLSEGSMSHLGGLFPRRSYPGTPRPECDEHVWMRDDAGAHNYRQGES